MKRTRFFSIMLASAVGLCTTTATAQVNLGDLPATVSASDAKIEGFGHLTMTVKDSLVFNDERQAYDTLHVTQQVEWNTEKGTATRRAAQRRAAAEPSDFFDMGSNSWFDAYWFRFYYPSVNAKGEPITLSALAAFPDEDRSHINNVIIGTHVTITSNKECPSAYNEVQTKERWQTDSGMLMWHGCSGTNAIGLRKDANNPLYYNLVILPDYEGYGLTRDLPHPYLYQELTARQVVDAVRYGIALYQNSSVIAPYRLPFRDGWRSASVGYSQGGSVAMATHRFIEQNGLDEELHFAGSVCGDGPYSPVDHVRYYLRENGGLLNMPVVLPLILKGMIDSNPYMREHKIEDYLVKDFIDTGILTWLEDKKQNDTEKTTDDITAALKAYYREGKFTNILNADGTAYIQNLMTPKVLEYFTTQANFIALPTKRGVCEDLHRALDSNNLTKGWQPKHQVRLWHYRTDTVVPYDNAVAAKQNLGPNCLLYTAGTGLDASWDHVGGGRVFFVGLNLGAAENQLLNCVLTGNTTDYVDK